MPPLLEAEVDDDDDELSSSTFKSFDGIEFRLPFASGLFSGGCGCWGATVDVTIGLLLLLFLFATCAITVVGELEVEDKRNKFGGAWLTEPEELEEICSLLLLLSRGIFGCG